MWITICFNTNDDFCDEKYKIPFDGYEIEIERGASNEGHLLFIETPDSEYEKAHEAGRRFLSEVAWLYGTQIEVLTYGGAGFGKMRFGVQPKEFYRIKNSLDLSSYEQITTDVKQRLALGIYKEGLSSRSHLYGFLCYARIINMVGKSFAQKKWINDNLHKISNQKELTDYFIKIGITDIGKHLYESGRCAIAHADIGSGDTIVDVDDFRESNRIYSELRFIKELSELYIRNELLVIDKKDLSSLRLLRGFRNLFGEVFINVSLLSQGEVAVSTYPDIPLLSLSLNKNKRKFSLFESLEFSIVSASKGVITLSNESQDYPLHGSIVIDFLQKNITFDILNVTLNRSHELFTLEFELDYQLFRKGCLLNGEVEILLSKDGSLISKLPSYVPFNIRINWKNIDSEIQKIEKMILNKM